MDINPLTELQALIVNFFPSPIAINYQRAITKGTWQDKARQLVLSFEFTVRALALALVSQYLLADREKVSDSHLNMLLREKLPKPSLGSWVEIFFTALTAYKDHRDLMFMPELYDTYWDSKQQRPQKGVREPFDEMVAIRNRLVHELPPQDDAGWQALFEESHNLLLRVFGFIRFISKYNLIFITDQDGDQYRYQIYQGQEIKESDTLVKLGGANNPGEGWFYLSRGDGENRRLLKLYPFLIAWGKDIDLAIEGVQSDAALLDKFSSSRIYYLATVLWESFFRQDDSLLADFFYNYEMSLGKKIKQKQLSWVALKEATQEIIEKNMGDSIKKYNPKLYLEREDVREVFEGFLASDKACLVITGKSGVGKTNFVMATLEAFRNNARVCTLVYNGARLPADRSVSELFRVDLATMLELSPQMTRGKEDVWGILSDVPDIGEKQMVVFIDAINENPQASDVLRQLDQLIGSNPYPWLKFVITSRPEAWRVMNRRIRLAEHRYYWRPGEEEMGVELQEFSHTDPISMTIKIDKFSRNEAHLAYQKYRDVFGLVTDYTELVVEMRQALQDPLMLRLIAEIYENNPIPTTLRVTQIYADFIDALVRSRRLYPEDVAFLQNDLVPRMAAKMGNALSEDDILADKALYEEIFNTDILSNGRQVNQSYASLVDAEILVALSQEEPISIAFKYERFYDYFMGKHYYKKYHNTSDIQVQYQELVETVRTSPFLWGAVKNALVSELEAGQKELLYKLACQPDQALRELVISVLTEFGQGKSDQFVILGLMKRLLAVHRERLGFWGRLRADLPDRVVERVDPIGRGAAMTALEVARRLRLADVLEEAVQDPSPHIRVIAMRNIYHYWRLESIAGFELLERLAERVMTSLGFPRAAVLESCLGITLLMMRHYHSQNEQGREIGTRLLAIWRGIIRRLLFLSGAETAGRRVLRSAIRNIIVDIIIRFIISTQESLPPSRPSFLRDVSFFFELDLTGKQRYDRLLTFFSSPRDISKIHDDLLKTVSENDTLTSLLMWLILISYGKVDTEKVLLIADELSKVALDQPTVGINACNLNIAIGHIGLSKPSIDENLYQLHVRMVENYLNKTHSFFYSNHGAKHSNLSLGEHGLLRRARRNPADRDLSEYFLRLAVEWQDWEFLDALLFDAVAQATAFYNPKAALQSLEALFPISNDRIRIKIAKSLSIIRTHYPELVDEFLYSLDPNNDLYNQISRIESPENPWLDLIQAPSGTILLRLLETSEIRSLVASILGQATSEVNIEHFMSMALKRIINQISGVRVFD